MIAEIEKFIGEKAFYAGGVDSDYYGLSVTVESLRELVGQIQASVPPPDGMCLVRRDDLICALNYGVACYTASQVGEARLRIMGVIAEPSAPATQAAQECVCDERGEVCGISQKDNNMIHKPSGYCVRCGHKLACHHKEP